MDKASVVLYRELKKIRQDGFNLNEGDLSFVASLLLDRMEAAGFLMITAPVLREELPAELPSFIGKNHVAVLACMMNSDKQYIDIANIRVRWDIPVDEEGDVEYLERLGYAERHPVMRCNARVTDRGRELVEQARADGYRPEKNWSWMGR